MFIGATFSIIDLIAVADVETLLGAVSPDRVLNEPRERPGEPAVELPRVDLLSDRLDDFGAAARPVTADPIGVVGPKPVQDAGPVQEIVHQSVDRDHAAADLAPEIGRTGPSSALCPRRRALLSVG